MHKPIFKNIVFYNAIALPAALQATLTLIKTLITPAVVPEGCTLFKLVYTNTKTIDKNLQK